MLEPPKSFQLYHSDHFSIETHGFGVPLNTQVLASCECPIGRVSVFIFSGTL